MKKIGRRYKSQFEDLQAKIDAEKEQQGQPSAETEAKIKELEESVAKANEVRIDCSLFIFIQIWCIWSLIYLETRNDCSI